jgi:hypothetical protein
MRLFTLLVLLAALTGAVAAAQANSGEGDPDRARANLVIHLRSAADDGFGRVVFSQPKDENKIVYLKVRLHGLAPGHGYYLQRATDTTVDDNCTGTNWLTLGQGPEPQKIVTDAKGNADAELFRDLAAVPVGTEFDIRFRVVDEAGGAVVLESGCDQFVVRQ